MIRKNTINEVLYTPGRATGNTTRQVDRAIQLLFDGYIVEVKDVYDGGRSKDANTYLFDRIIRRLKFEHRIEPRHGIKINYSKLEIQLEIPND